MKWANIQLITIRELRDQVRDRRTLFTIFVLPLVLYPLLGMVFLQVAQFTKEHPARVWIIGRENLPDTPPLLEGDRFVLRHFFAAEDADLLELDFSEPLASLDDEAIRRDEAQQAILHRGVGAVVYFPENFREELARYRRQFERNGAASAQPPAGDPPQPQVYFNTAKDKSRLAHERVAAVLSRWREAIVQESLRAHNLPIDAARPFEVVQNDMADVHLRRAMVWSKILPFIVLVWALTGAFYPAIDLCAGEKERGTLETLLSSPAERSEIVLGKLLTVMSFSMATALLNLVSMAVTGTVIMGQLARLGPVAAQLGLGPPPLLSLLWLVLALVPISALFSALSLAVASFARSSKEGQYYLMPLLMISLPLMMLPLLPTIELDLGASLIPISGVMLLLRALIEGDYAAAFPYLLPVVGVTGLCCYFAIRWAIDQFNNESVLFRESERFGIGLWLRHMLRDRDATPTAAEAVFCGVLLLVIRFFATLAMAPPTSFAEFAVIQTVTLVALIATPALLMAIMLTSSPQATLLLRAPPWAAIPAAVVLALALHPTAMLAAEAVQTLYPLGADTRRQLEAIGALIGDTPNLWLLLLVMALLPAVCEELAFRGFILSGLRRSGHKWLAIVVSSVFFGAAHGLLQQSITACLLGVVLGYLAVQTGSLLPPLLYHLTHNAATFSLGAAVDRWPWLAAVVRADEHGIAYTWTATGVGLLIAGAIFAWLRTLPYTQYAEEKLQAALDHQSPQPATD